MRSARINIAIAGHTNAGKTTLIRTLMRSPAGVVGDQANVTKLHAVYEYESLQANFIDSPGFQHGLATQMYLTEKKQNPNSQSIQRWESKLGYDLEAVKAIENSQVVLYVGNLESVPDDSFQEEIEIVKLIQPTIVAVLNKRRQLIKAKGEQEINNRISQWTQVCKDKGIDRVIVFDAHWDNPAKVKKIYDSIFEVLDQQYKQIFHEGLEKFAKRQKEIRKEACRMLASCIEDCKSKGIRELKKSNADEQQIEELKTSIAVDINDELLLFTFMSSKLYEVAAQNPTLSKNDLLVKIGKKASYKSRLGFGSGAAGILGAIGAAAGAAFGAAIVGLFTGGVGAFAGALSGAQLGGTVGAGLGALGIFYDDDDTVTIKITPKQAESIMIQGIAIIWGLSNNGFGRGRDVTEEEIKDIEDQILNYQSQNSNLDLDKASQAEIIKHCENILDVLEKKE